jgi:GGDEF domain-containing protein
VLQALANILIEELRGVDQVGRLGGEEFAIQFWKRRGAERWKCAGACCPGSARRRSLRRPRKSSSPSAPD